MVPIVCIGNYHIDKKIKELMKVCNSVELPIPTYHQIECITKILMPSLEKNLIENMITYIQGDLRKLCSTYEIYKNQHSILKNQLIRDIFQPKAFNEDTKQITKKLLNIKYKINDHTLVMNETDRTSVGLLFHENIIDALKPIHKKISIPFYLSILDNICFADYIDRITFQKQIWIFNEMSSLIKTFYNNKSYHDKFKHKFDHEPIRFTKVLTKYSTEYNNLLFIQKMCQQLGMDKKDMISFFLDLRDKHPIDEIYMKFNNENYDIAKLDINRIYRFLDKYTLEDEF